MILKYKTQKLYNRVQQSKHETMKADELGEVFKDWSKDDLDALITSLEKRQEALREPEAKREESSGADEKKAHVDVRDITPAERKQLVTDSVRLAFNHYDADDSGFIEYDELVVLFKNMYEHCSHTFGVIYSMNFEEYDLNKDGKVSFEEFDTVFRRIFDDGFDARPVARAVEKLCSGARVHDE
jgi:Ca2+-binding EF-hand superfamily protein